LNGLKGRRGEGESGGEEDEVMRRVGEGVIGVNA